MENKHNVDSMLAGIELTVRINQASRATKRFAKQTLTRIEADGTLTPQVRKHVLDGFADLQREIEKLLTN